MKFKRITACLLAAVMTVGSTAVPVVGTTAYAASEDAIGVLDGIEYIGDRSKCQMDGEMANAYADVLKRLPSQRGSERLAVTLLDPSGDGYPIMFTVYSEFFDQMISPHYYGECSSPQVWVYKNGKAEEYDFGKEFDYDLPYEFYIDRINEGIVFCASVNGGGGAWAPVMGKCFYQVKNAQLNPLHQLRLEDYDADYEWDIFLDDVKCTEDNMPMEAVGVNNLEAYQSITACGSLIILDTAMTVASKAITVLQDYAELADGYSYPEAEDVDDAALVKAIADAVAKEVDGEIAGIYKLADGIYYVVIIVGDAEKGALVCGSKTDGTVSWKVSEIHDERVSQDELDKILQDILSKSNVELDYGKLSGAETSDVVSYIQSQIDNMNGVTPNDAAKSELAEYIESAISSSCGVAVKGKDNRLNLKSKDVATLAEQALAEKQQYEELLKANDIELNKKLVIMVRILWQNMDNGVPCQITLNQDLLDALSGCDIQIILTDAQHYVQLSAKNLQKLIDKYGEVQIQMAKDGEATYTINFLDKLGNTVEKLIVPVTFGLPAISELSTVMASYGDKNTNWGGQFDPNTMSLAFDVSFSGRYEIIENKLDIADIKDLSEESQKAISFMVSKGYMGLVNELFHPEDPLTRYEFAQALVGMFFALDTALKTNFVDVPADSQYYSYVASGEEKEIIQGFTATEFGGDRNMTVEQMLAFAARTLIDSKGYAEPADADSYLTSFSDGDEVSDWAKAQVALAVREGLIDRGGELNPGEEVTREQAAVILYRLFLLLYEVPKVELELPPTTGVGGGAVAAAVGGVVVVGGAAAVFMKKKKK